MMKNLITNIVLFIVLFVIATYSINVLFSNNDINFELEITYRAEKNNIFQVFYTNGESIKEFSEIHSQKNNILSSNVFATERFYLPIGKIDKLRIDFGTQPGQVIIKEIKLIRFFNSYKWIPRNIIEVFENQNDISNFYIKNDLLYIESFGMDPYLYTNNISGVNNTKLNAIELSISLLFSIIIFFFIKSLIRFSKNKILINRLRIYLYTFYKYKGLLRELVLRDIKVKYKKSFLGILWSLLNPLLMMTVTYIVFSNLFRFDIKNFPIYLLTGQIFFNFFSESANTAISSIILNSSLIRKVYIPKYIFPASKVLSAFVNLLFSLIALVLMVLITKIEITWTILLFPLSLIYLFMFALGIGLILSVYAVFFRDLIHLFGIILTIWIYLTPIFYPISIIPEKYQILIKLNPMFYYIEHFRQIILYARVPSLSLNIACLSISVITVIIGIFAFYKKQDKFMLFI